MKTEFKVGDKISIIDALPFDDGFKIGETGVIWMATKYVIGIKMHDGRYQVLTPDIAYKYIKLVQSANSDSGSIDHPAYYNDGKIEVIDFIEDKGLNFNKGNAVKYIARAGKKDKAKEVEDLQKAKWYIEREIKRVSVDR